MKKTRKFGKMSQKLRYLIDRVETITQKSSWQQGYTSGYNDGVQDGVRTGKGKP